MTEFTPFASIFGGALIGLSAVLLMAWEGRIAGNQRHCRASAPAVARQRLAFPAGICARTGCRPAGHAGNRR